MHTKKCLAFVIAGGKGERLYPLTKDRTKPSVPFGGKYRIVDFVLSNLINSGIYSIYVLVQYKSQSLIEHIRTGRRRSGLAIDHFITVVPAQMRVEDSSWYKGTADAIFQNINLIIDSKPDMILVFAADHIYRMDIRHMIEFHLQKKADATVATLPVSFNDAHKFGIIQINKDERIINFVEKPKNPKALFDKKASIFTSMGNYIFNTELLLDVLIKDARKKGSEHDFGKNIIPTIVRTNKVFAYSFENNIIPGLKDYEDKDYWRDVGTLQAYWQANMDLLKPNPAMDLNNNSWPVITADYDGPPARIVSGDIKNSIIGEGSIIEEATIRNSVIARGVTVEKGAYIKDSIIMGFTRIGKNARLNRVIVDRFNLIENNAKIGYDKAGDKKRFFLDKESGLVVVTRGGRELTL
jgi:glucose-1-phosphate adenylyltransferase